MNKLTPREPTPYGRCPICGANGVARERRPNGNDRCANGHTYPSASAMHDAAPSVPSVEQELLDRLANLCRRAINEANGLTNYVDERPELHGAEKRIAKIEQEFRAAIARAKGE